jgi:hypothetical protein
MFDPLDSELAGEGNDQESVAGASDGNPYHEVWRTQAKWNSGRWRWICQKKERDHQWCLRMGVYGTGETMARQEISRRSNHVLWRECGLGDGVCKKQYSCRANSYSGRYDSVVSCRTVFCMQLITPEATLANRNSGLLRNGFTLKIEM